MGLILEISLDRDIKHLEKFFTDLRFKAITTAARQGINKAADSTRSMAIKEIQKKRNIALKDLKGGKGRRGFVTVKKARGKNLASLEASVDFSGRVIPMIFLIVGRKTPKSFRIPNSRRKSRTFEIVKGARSTKKGLFIQKAARGQRRFEVFRRADPKDRSKGFRTQSLPSVVHLLRSQADAIRRIENASLNFLQKEYNIALTLQLSKLKF